MIVNQTHDGFRIIFHAAHGLLAGKIANALLPSFRPEPWFETLVAITDHDDRQLNFEEKNYLSVLGVPIDFIDEKQNIYEILKRIKRITREAKNKSSWTRLMISFHIEFLYGALAETSSYLKQFFIEDANERTVILKLYNLSIEQARANYEVLRFCDRLSLILCKDETPALGRLLEINHSIKDKTYFVKQNKEGHITIEPWVFQTNVIELCVEERYLEVAQFKSQKDFETQLMQESPSLKCWKLHKNLKSTEPYQK